MKYISLMMLLAFSSSFSATLPTGDLPLTFKCTTEAGGGVLRENDKWKKSGFQPEAKKFSLTIDSFDSKSSENRKKCDVAILASGKERDSVSKMYRAQTQEVCAIVAYEQKEKLPLMGPVIWYCRNLDGRAGIACGDTLMGGFFFDYSKQIFFELPSPSMGGDISEAIVFAGECKK